MNPGPLLIALAAVLWGTLGATARVALDAGVPPLTLAFCRATIAALLYAGHARATRAPGIAPHDYKWTVALGLGGVSIFYVAYLQSVQAGGVALAAILLYTAPVWVAIGARVWLAEPITQRTAVTIAFTIAGVALVALAGSSGVTTTPASIAWGLLSGITYALYYLLGRRLFAGYRPERVLSIALAVGAAAMLPWVSFASLAQAPLRAWIAIVAIAVVPTYFAYLAYAEGLKRIAAARASTIATLEPVVAVAIAYVVWGEALRPLALLGAVLVIGGVMMASRGERWEA